MSVSALFKMEAEVIQKYREIATEEILERLENNRQNCNAADNHSDWFDVDQDWAHMQMAWEVFVRRVQAEIAPIVRQSDVPRDVKLQQYESVEKAKARYKATVDCANIAKCCTRATHYITAGRVAEAMASFDEGIYMLELSGRLKLQLAQHFFLLKHILAIVLEMGGEDIVTEMQRRLVEHRDRLEESDEGGAENEDLLDFVEGVHFDGQRVLQGIKKAEGWGEIIGLQIVNEDMYARYLEEFVDQQAQQALIYTGLDGEVCDFCGEIHGEDEGYEGEMCELCGEDREDDDEVCGFCGQPYDLADESEVLSQATMWATIRNSILAAEQGVLSQDDWIAQLKRYRQMCWDNQDTDTADKFSIAILEAS